MQIFNLTGKLHTYLANLNEQTQNRYQCIVRQMMETGGVAAELKRNAQMRWVQHIGSIANRAEEIIRHEMIYVWRLPGVYNADNIRAAWVNLTQAAFYVPFIFRVADA